ncbi:MAG: signal peptidase I [Candidatus Thermoplasmatota archaeon]|nr:signal peptidase I [Candidatus Thermoplasmatota archaeon]
MMILLLLHLILILILQRTLLPSLGMFGAYVVRPLLWISIAVTAFLLASRQGKNILQFKRVRRWYLGNSPVHAGLMLGIFQVSMLVIIGIFTKFGRSPYSFTPQGILINLVYVGSFLIGIELARSYVVNTMNLSKKHLTLIIILTTLLFMFIQLPFDNLSLLTFDRPVPALEFLGKTFITALTINLLATYLAYLGGATASMSYTGVLLCFEWFSPIIPDPHWTLLALVGTIAPAIGFIVLQGSLITPQEQRQMRRLRRKEKRSDNWTFVAILVVIIVFFSFGFLGVTPTVIYSGSMAPEYQVGDIVLIDDVNTSTLQVGDIVQYLSFDNTSKIIHRIVEITEEDGRTYYLTKGDANPSDDFRPIPAQRILGRPMFTIPKLGWVQIVVKSTFNALGIPI